MKSKKADVKDIGSLLCGCELRGVVATCYRASQQAARGERRMTQVIAARGASPLPHLIAAERRSSRRKS